MYKYIIQRAGNDGYLLVRWFFVRNSLEWIIATTRE
jgi:hypothetical protein